MAKQCPHCRTIVSTNTSNCNCGFQFFKTKIKANTDSLSKYCMRIGGGVFVIAGLAVVAMRFL